MICPLPESIKHPDTIYLCLLCGTVDDLSTLNMNLIVILTSSIKSFLLLFNTYVFFVLIIFWREF